MGTGYLTKDSMLSPSELDEKGIKAKKNHIYFEDNDGKIRTFKYSSKSDWSDTRHEYMNLEKVSPSTLEKIANSTGLTISTIKNNIGSMIRHFKQGTKGVERQNRGGAIKKYSHGGGVSSGHQLTYKRK